MAQAACPVRNDFSYTWARNAYGRDPCAVATSLRTICNPADAMRPFWSDQYNPPTRQSQNACTCSTVVYALVSACSDCQISGSWHTGDWNFYSANCQKKYQGFFNPALIPVEATPPDWAYFDVSRQPSFDRGRAQASATANPPAPVTTSAPQTTQQPQQPQPTQQTQQPQQPDQTPTTTPDDTNPSQPTDPTATSLSSDTSTQSLTLTVTSIGSSTTIASADLSAISVASVASVASLRSLLGADYSADPLLQGGSSPTNGIVSNPDATGTTTPSGALAEKKSNTGAIAGSVVGALLFVALLVGGFLWWRARRRRARVAPSAAYIASYGSDRSGTSMSQRPFTERSHTNLFSERYSDAPEMRDSTYSGNTGPHPSYRQESPSLPQPYAV